MQKKISTLDEVNKASREDLIDLLTELFCSRPLAKAVVARRPFSDMDALRRAARSELERQPDAHVLEAIKAHPAIGSPVRSGSLSEREQSTANTSDEQSQQAMGEIRGLSERYEEKHGFTFLIRAAGLTSQQILESIRLRIENSTEVEKVIARSQLAEINELRLVGILD